MEKQNISSEQKMTNLTDNLYSEKINKIQQNDKLLQYQREIIQESLDFVIGVNREKTQISDIEYIKLLNYYLEQRKEINKQLRANTKNQMVLEIQKLYLSMQQAKMNLSKIKIQTCEWSSLLSKLITICRQDRYSLR